MKAYVKPDLFYENFKLDTHLATCTWNFSNTLAEVEGCSAQGEVDGVKFEGVFLNNAGSTCTVKLTQYCYETTQGVEGTFNS